MLSLVQGDWILSLAHCILGNRRLCGAYRLDNFVDVKVFRQITLSFFEGLAVLDLAFGDSWSGDSRKGSDPTAKKKCKRGGTNPTPLLNIYFNVGIMPL